MLFLIDYFIDNNPFVKSSTVSKVLFNSAELNAMLPVKLKDFPSLGNVYYEHYQLRRRNRIRFSGKINLDKIKEFCKLNKLKCVEENDWIFFHYGPPLNINKWNLERNKKAKIYIYDKPILKIEYYGNDKYALRIIVAKENGLFAGYMLYPYPYR